MADQRLMDLIDRMGYAGTKGLALANDPSMDNESVALSYGGFLSRGSADAAYAVGGMPQIYFKWLDGIDPQIGRDYHRVAWNRGDAPILCLASGDLVYVYNAYAHPRKLVGDETDQERAGALLKVLTATDRSLRDVYGRLCFDTGSFWTTEPAGKITPVERVDRQLLEDIAHARDLLVDQGLPLQIAQAILGRAIFLSYLKDRRILSPGFLREEFGHEALADVFRQQDSALALFAWMADAFNGDLFPLSDAQSKQLNPHHWTTLADFLSGQKMSTGQMRLWPYDFAIIPVELVSSLYEMFTRKETQAPRRRQTKQGASPRRNLTGVHYTPPLLVRSIVEEAMQGLPDTVRVLDPACGSGAFLVEVFKRLAFRRERRTGTPLTFDDLGDLLASQVFGLEISLDAGRIAAFSLYLALLETASELPPASEIRLPHLEGRSLFSGSDAFDETAEYNQLEPFASRSFDAVVGNPPWTQSKEHSLSARLYCKRRDLPIDNNQPYHAFLWRGGELVREAGRVAMMVPATMLFQPRAPRTVQRLLSQYARVHVVNLMHLREAQIFQGVTAPPAVVFFDNVLPTEGAVVRYDTPRMSRAVDTTKHIVVLDDDRVDLPADVIRRDHSVWKSAFWGTAADWALVQRLREHGTLGDLAASRGWEVGAGCGVFNLKRKGLDQRRNKGTYPPPNLIGRPLLREEEIPPYGGSLALTAVGKTDRADRWRDKKTPALFFRQQLLVARAPRGGRVAAAYVPSGIVFSQRYWGISLPAGDEPLGQYLSAVLNSDIAEYFIFLVGSRWGVERDDVLPSEIAGLPIPGWCDLSKDARCSIRELEDSLRQATHGDLDPRDTVEHNELQQLIADAYGLTALERDFVDEVVNFTVDFFRDEDASRAVARPDGSDLEAYAQVLAVNLDPYLTQAGKMADITIWGSASDPLQVVQVAEVAAADHGTRVTHQRESSLVDALASLSEALHRQVDQNVAVRRCMRVYDPNAGLFIIKHAERRYWTKAAAHRDAGAIVSDHLR